MLLDDHMISDHIIPFSTYVVKVQVVLLAIRQLAQSSQKREEKKRNEAFIEGEFLSC